MNTPNTAANDSGGGSEGTFTELTVITETRDRIMYLLEVYPYVSRAMIQVGLSPACPPALWDPILQDLVARGSVLITTVNTKTPKDRNLTKDIYHLPTYPYPPVTLRQLEIAEDLAGITPDAE